MTTILTENGVKSNLGFVAFLFLLLHLSTAGPVPVPVSDTPSEDLTEKNAIVRNDPGNDIRSSILRVENTFGNNMQANDSLSVFEAKGGRGYGSGGGSHDGGKSEPGTATFWFILTIVFIGAVLMIVYCCRSYE